MRRRLGLLINPIAGLGGRVALNGSDHCVAEALQRGARAQSGIRAAEALAAMMRILGDAEIVCRDGPMGGDIVRALSHTPTIVGEAPVGRSCREDTHIAVRAIADHGVDLLLFAGGDGTARDIMDVAPRDLTVLGIPAGVKMFSGIFAVTPAAAGVLAASFLEKPDLLRTTDADIMDADEKARAAGRLDIRLYGALRTPHHARLRQNAKAGAVPSEPVALRRLAASVVADFQPETLYLLGPGTTLAAIKSVVGIENSLFGVDAVKSEHVLGRNLTEDDLLLLVKSHLHVKLVVSPLGGHGFVFGRGNQQLSPAVLQRIGRDNIILVATMTKLLSLGHAELLLDTGDAKLDAELSGWHRVIVGPRQTTVRYLA